MLWEIFQICWFVSKFITNACSKPQEFSTFCVVNRRSLLHLVFYIIVDSCSALRLTKAHSDSVIWERNSCALRCLLNRLARMRVERKTENKSMRSRKEISREPPDSDEFQLGEDASFAVFRFVRLSGSKRLKFGVKEIEWEDKKSRHSGDYRPCDE